MIWQLRQAQQAEAAALSELALRSKAVWGYDAEFLRACEKELTITQADIAQADWPCTVATDQASAPDRLLGFYLLRRKSSVEAELEALFIEPGIMGHGIGRALLMHAFGMLRTHQIGQLKIQSDPGAKGFYERMGAVQIGERPSGSIKGRSLPLLHVML